MVRDEYRIQTGLQGGVDVAARTVPHHPSVRLYDVVLVYQPRVGRGILLHDDFNGSEESLETGLFHLRGLFRGMALGEQDEAVGPAR